MRRRLARQEGQSPQGKANLPEPIYGLRHLTSDTRCEGDVHHETYDDDASAYDSARDRDGAERTDDDNAQKSPPFSMRDHEHPGWNNNAQHRHE